MNINELVKDIEISQNLGKKYMYYNTYRPNVPTNRQIRMPFFGTCKVHKVHKMKNDFRLTVEVPMTNAKNAIIGIIDHIKNMDASKTKELNLSEAVE